MCRDLGLEAALKHRGIDFEFREQVLLSDINVKGSHQNPARLGLRVNPAVVWAIFCVVYNTDGTEGIPGVIVSDRHSPMDLLDGVNRCDGVTEADKPAIDAYIIKSTDEFVLEFVASWANNRNGSAPVQDQRLRRAVELHERWPDKSADFIAKWLDLKENEVADFRKLREQAKRADDMDLTPQFNGLKPKVQLALGRIVLDALFAAVVRALAESGATIGPSLDLINRVAKARSEDAARRVIDEWKDENPPVRPGPRPGPPTITGKYRKAHVTLFNVWPGSVERVQLGSLDLKGLIHMLDIVTQNHERSEQAIARLKDLIEYHRKHPPVAPPGDAARGGGA